MDQETLVERQVDDGAKIVEKLRESGFDVAAAWWMKAGEDGIWFLYIASKEVDENGIRAAYHSVNTIKGALGQLWVDRFRVKLVSPLNPVAKDVIDILTRYPGQLPMRSGGRKLGNISIDDSYIYPLPVAA